MTIHSFRLGEANYKYCSEREGEGGVFLHPVEYYYKAAREEISEDTLGEDSLHKVDVQAESIEVMEVHILMALKGKQTSEEVGFG